jgi:outer membrane protein assembly factor BamB
MVYPIVELEDERTQLEALNARSGSRIWSFLPGKGYIHSLVVVGGMAYIYVAEVDILNVLDESSGIRKWSRNGILSSPLVVNGVVYVGFQNEMFSALDAHSGNTRWSISQWNNNQPLMVNGIIYLFSNFKIWAIQPPA